MPLYSFRNTETDEVFTEMVKMDDYDAYLAANPTYVRVYDKAPSVGDPVQGKKPSDGFRDILREVKKKHKNALSGGTNINTW